MTVDYFKITEDILRGKQISKDEIGILLAADPHSLLYGANRIREKYKGNNIDLCAVVNAKSGLCAEDCKFCAQSARYNTGSSIYPLITLKEMIARAKKAKAIKAERFGIVTSGNKVNKQEIRVIAEAIADFKEMIIPCVSLGNIDEDLLKELKYAGLSRYHHNLETSERFFPYVCTTHTYCERVATVDLLKKYDFEVCSGGLFGLGEEWEDRIDLALTLRKLEVDSVPLNFLFPVKNTPLEQQERLTPFEILRIIAIFRYILPDKDIRVCGGREKNLRDLQSWMFYAGANGTMIGNYLTTEGRKPEDDLKMIKDLGLEIK